MNLWSMNQDIIINTSSHYHKCDIDWSKQNWENINTITNINKKKNLWEDIIQIFLKKIEMIHKKSSSYHSRINEKVKRLNDILENMISKLLLKKSIKL